MELKVFFAQNPRAALGFSGGVDSAYLLYAACQYGAQVQPYYIKTCFQPQFEYEDALAVCTKLGVELRVVEHNILEDSVIASNPQNRCYYCKKTMFSMLTKRAAQDGFSLVLDGTNYSDDLSDRPGAAAIRELGVRSPLRECALTKDMIRQLSKEAGLFTWDKPAYACLATRVPTGQIITSDILAKVEICENRLTEMGYSDFRVRVMGDCARLQIKENQFEMFVLKRKEILDVLKPCFESVLLDMEAR